MKRSELKVGDELYHATAAEWKTGSAGAKVKVLAVEPYTYTRHGIGFSQAEPGRPGRVLVEMARWGEPGEYLVRLCDLHGPWDKINAQVEEQQCEKRQALADAEAAREARRQLRAEESTTRDAAIERAAGMGFKTTTIRGWADPSSTAVVLDMTVLTEMLDRIQQLNEERNALIAEVNGDPPLGWMEAPRDHAS